MGRARACRQRLASWAANDRRVAAAIVYGSVAAGTDHQYSDLDVVLVAHDGDRESLWRDRAQVAREVLGDVVAWSHEVPWQRPYRYQAWGDGFDVMVDLTFDEGAPDLWRGVVEAYEIVTASAEIEETLRQQLAGWTAGSVDAPALDERAWPWLGYLDANLRKGNTWMVRAGLHDFLDAHVLPLLVDRPDAIEADLTEEQHQAVHDAAPASHRVLELRRSLRETTDLYVQSFEDWAERHGQSITVHPMAHPLQQRFRVE